MLPDRVSNPGPLTYESGALPIALRGLANYGCTAVNGPFPFFPSSVYTFDQRLIPISDFPQCHLFAAASYSPWGVLFLDQSEDLLQNIVVSQLRIIVKKTHC